MALAWVLFNLTGTLVDPPVMAQPLGDSAADEQLALNVIDDTIAIADGRRAHGLQHAVHPDDGGRDARRLRLSGTDEERALSALELVSTMPAYLEAPGRAEVTPGPRAEARRAGADLGPGGGRGAALRRPARSPRAGAQRAGLRRLQAGPAAVPDGARADGRRRRRGVLRLDPLVGRRGSQAGGPAHRLGRAPRALASRHRPGADYTGRDLAEVAEAIVTRIAA